MLEEKITFRSVIVEPGQAVLLPRCTAQTLCALDQPLWATQAGKPEDIVLLKGQCIALYGRQAVVVQSLAGRAEFRISCRKSWRPRWRDALVKSFHAVTLLVRRVMVDWFLANLQGQPLLQKHWEHA